MKHNWEYKPLKQLANILYGCPFDSEFFNSESKGMPLIRIRDVKPGYTSTYFNGSYSSEYLIKKGEYLIGMDGEFNIAPWKSKEALLNQRVCRVKSSNEDIVLSDFIYYYLGKELKHIESKTSFVTVKHLSAKVLNAINHPVPPREVQEQIVAELDQINDLIAKNRELLSQLDNLAQSLFYDTFGDPILNPKGFKISKLGSSNTISSAKRVLVQDVVDNGIPFIRGTELAILSKQNAFDPSIFTMFITPDHFEKVKSITGVPALNDLLIPSINADGYVWEVNTPDPFYFKDGRVLWVHVNHESYSSKWLRFALSKMIIEKYANISRGAVFAELTLVFLRNLDMIVPPLSLQNAFAEKVEAIEAQKAKVEAEIAVLHTLLDARMDYWFN